MKCCNIFEEFDEENNLIKEYKYWKLLVRNRNKTLGNCVAILKRHIERFDEINEEEIKDYINVVKDIEFSLRKSFNCKKLNYQMTMMKDLHLHFHIFPRYDENKNFAGQIWIDYGFPKVPSEKDQEFEINKEILKEIRNKIIGCLE